MKKKILLVLLFVFISIFAYGCKNKTTSTISSDESTIIKDAKSVDKFLKKGDYKSLAYAYVYNMKEGLDSYIQTTEGNLKAKIMFVNYQVDFTSTTIKKGSTFFSKDHSESTFSNLESEYYLNGDGRILFSPDSKEYTVYDVKEFRQKDITPDQLLISSYIVTDESIISAELIKEEDNVIEIKYVLDNTLSTKFAQIAMYYTGGLSDYPEFSSVELTLKMTRDIMPISYKVELIYDAKRPVLGSATVTHYFETKFEKINEEVEIPNESFYKEKLGQEIEKINIDEKNSEKDELLKSLANINYKDGINIDGNLGISIEQLTLDFNLAIESSIIFDSSRLTEDNLYSVGQMHASLVGDDNLSNVIGIVKSFIGDKLGDYAEILDDFRGIEIAYSGDGKIYLIPYNDENKYYASFELKLVDVLDKIISKVNFYNLINNSGNSDVKFIKHPTDIESNYSIELVLNEEAITNIKEKTENIVLNDQSDMINMIFDYKEFDNIKIIIDVKDDKVNSLEVDFTYFKNATPDVPTKLLELKLEIKDLQYDFNEIGDLVTINETYKSIKSIREELDFYKSHIYLSKSYIKEASEIISRYNELDDLQKSFIDPLVITTIEENISKIEKILPFVKTFYEFDFENVSNEKLYQLMVEYNNLGYSLQLLKDVLSDEDINKLSSLSEYIDYSRVDVAVFKLMSTDSATWNLTVEEINDFYTIALIGEINPGVNFMMMLKVMMVNPLLSYDSFVLTIKDMKNNQ